MQTNITEQLEAARAAFKSAGARMEAANGRSQAIMSRSRGRDLTADEQVQVDKLFNTFDMAEADAREAQAQITELEATPQPRLTQPRAVGNGRTPTERLPASRGMPISNFASLFGSAQPADPYNGQFQTLGAFALAVAAGGNDQRLIRNSSTTSTSGDGQSAGFLVPQQMVQMLMDQALLREVVRPRANVVPIVVGQATVSGFDSTNGTGSKRAGLYLAWGSEAADLVPQKPRAREVNYVAKKAHIFCRVSTELAEDAPNFDNMLTKAMIAAVAAGLDAAFISGTGAGEPLGIINAPNLVTVSKESGQAASTLFLQNLAKMVGRLTPSSFARSVWLVHPTAVPQLYLMSYTVKNVAGTENVGGTAAQAITVDANGQLRIFGLPCIVTDACAALSSKGDVMLADLSHYLIAMRSDVRLKRDESRYFDTDEIAFRLTMRLDGMPDDSAVTTLRDGTNTVSPFVTLEAR